MPSGRAHPWNGGCWWRFKIKFYGPLEKEIGDDWSFRSAEDSLQIEVTQFHFLYMQNDLWSKTTYSTKKTFLFLCFRCTRYAKDKDSSDSSRMYYEARFLEACNFCRRFGIQVGGLRGKTQRWHWETPGKPLSGGKRGWEDDMHCWHYWIFLIWFFVRWNWDGSEIWRKGTLLNIKSCLRRFTHVYSRQKWINNNYWDLIEMIQFSFSSKIPKARHLTTIFLNPQAARGSKAQSWRSLGTDKFLLQR